MITALLLAVFLGTAAAVILIIYLILCRYPAQFHFVKIVVL